MQLLLHSSEIEAAVLLLAAVWLLVPFTLKLFRSVVAGRKLRHVPGPRMGLRGVTPVLRVRSGYIQYRRKLKQGLATRSAESHLKGVLLFAISLCICYVATCLVPAVSTILINRQ